MGKYRKLSERRTWAWWIAPSIVKPVLLATTKRDWSGGERIPATGGAVIALNHISHVDPLTAAHIVWDHGRLPRYLAKASMFKNRYFARFLDSAGQIPVDRRRGAGAFDAAVAAVQNGGLVVVYIEGSITKDPDGWPMKGKSGAARIALETGCPVIPVGQWGAQRLLPAYAAKPNLKGRTTIRMAVGEPVDLADLADLADGTPSAAGVAEATDRIMAAITGLVADLRGGTPPSEPYDPRQHGVEATGNPNRRTTKGRMKKFRRKGKR